MLSVGPKTLTPPFETALPAAIPGPPTSGGGGSFRARGSDRTCSLSTTALQRACGFRQGALSFPFFTHMTAPRCNHFTDVIHSKET